jgi:hypothetical protein
MSRSRVRSFALFVGIASAMAASAAGADCLRYEAGPVVVAGILEQQTFPGGPNYQSIFTGDEAETGYYLRPRAALCAVAGAKGGADVEARKGVWLVQLVLNPEDRSLLRSRLGQSVRVRGRLFSSHTGHHHAPLLLEFAGLEDAR